MYTYEYERIRFTGIMKLRSEDHEDMINRRAENGWRYVGFIPAVLSRGFLEEIDLIFEKEL